MVLLNFEYRILFGKIKTNIQNSTRPNLAVEDISFVKENGRFFQIFLAFSEYLDFDNTMY